MKLSILYILALLIVIVTQPIFAEDYSHAFPARTGDSYSRNRDYIVHTPTGYNTGQAYPLVMVLHGCYQDHNTMVAGTLFNGIADTQGFVVVYPYITSYDGLRNLNCWGYWLSQHKHRNQGEPGDLAGIVNEVKGNYSIDSNRVHITGLSSGGGMTTIMMVTYTDIFASGAPAAGLAYDETAASAGAFGSFVSPSTSASSMISEMNSYDGLRIVPTIIMHSLSDQGVLIQGAYNNRDAWGIVHNIATGIGDEVWTDTGTAPSGHSWTHKAYGTGTYEGAIQTHLTSGLSHAWLGGADAAYLSYDNYCFDEGPSWAQTAWDFFKAHPMEGSTDQNPTITFNRATYSPPDCIDFELNVTDDEIVVSVDVAVDSGSWISANHQTGDIWSQQLCGLSGGNHTTHARAEDNNANSTEIQGPDVAIEINAPEIIVNKIEYAVPDCIDFDLTVVDDTGVNSVEVAVDSGSLLLAEFQGENNWTKQVCGLTTGNHTTFVKATDDDANVNELQGPGVFVGSTPVCFDFTAANTQHVDEGRAYSVTTGWWWNLTTTYYATGSDQTLGTNGNAVTSLKTEDNLDYLIGVCGPGGTANQIYTMTSESGYAKANCDSSGINVGTYSYLYFGVGYDGKLSRSIFTFDTSSIPDSAALNSSRIIFTHDTSFVGDVYNQLGPITVDIKNGTFGLAAIESSDWNANADGLSVATIGTDNGTYAGSVTTNGNLNSAGILEINKQGLTQFRVMTNHCEGTNNYHSFNNAVLEVIYTR